MWRIVNGERGAELRQTVGFTDVLQDSSGKKFCSKKAATDAMNSRFIAAAQACGAPRVHLATMQCTLNATRPTADRSLRLAPFTAVEVYRIVMSRIPIKPTKDIYEVSMQLLHSAVIPLSPCLAELFNRCIKIGLYPRAMKLSKISPVYKGQGKRGDIDNYRPVSIIPAVAKVFENGISTRLTNYLTEIKALSNRQYAYRAGRSTTSLVRDVIRRALEACENKQKVAVLCCDLSKAFDVADHGVLAAKLQYYGITGSAHALLTDLLRQRHQIVVANRGELKSDPLMAVMGVAQGSSVSNILFSLLLNDLPNSIKTGEVFMYADDVAVVVCGVNINALEQHLNEAALEVSNWFKINGLVLNLKKTHFMQFSISGRKFRKLAVYIDKEPLKQVEATRFLGFKVDQGLTWSSHIDELCAKLGSACYALSRLSRVVSTDIVQTCYFATVHSILQYGAELWGHAADRLRAFRMQKRAVRAIAKISRETSAKPYFASLGILTLPSIVIMQIAMYTWDNLHDYERRGDRHNYTTRHANKLAAVTHHFTKSSKLTQVMGPKIFNRLPESVTSALTRTGFKAKLKCWLAQSVFYTVDELTNEKIV